ncbi:MAG: hypothetical protein QW767_06255 [Thermoprotei archaeon]
MPSVMFCVKDEAELSDKRTLITWRAAVSLSIEVYPEGSEYFSKLEVPHVAEAKEVLAWRVALNRVKMMPKKELPFDPKKYEEDWFTDYESIANELKTSVEHVSLMIRSADQPLMTTVLEEIANAMLHSNQLKHEVTLKDRSRFKDQ